MRWQANAPEAASRRPPPPRAAKRLADENVIEAPAAMVDELGLFGLHPALLDMATGFFVGRESHASLPLAYGRIEIFGAMPARFYAHAVLKSAPGTSLRRLDIAIAGEDGQPIAVIEDYTLTSPTLRGMP